MSKRKKQSKFCLDLMVKLNQEINKDLIKPSVIKDDIKRLRRELTELSKMFEWDYRED